MFVRGVCLFVVELLLHFCPDSHQMWTPDRYSKEKFDENVELGGLIGTPHVECALCSNCCIPHYYGHCYIISREEIGDIMQIHIDACAY